MFDRHNTALQLSSHCRERHETGRSLFVLALGPVDGVPQLSWEGGLSVDGEWFSQLCLLNNACEINYAVGAQYTR